MKALISALPSHRLLAHRAGPVDQALLVRNEPLATEDKLLRTVTNKPWGHDRVVGAHRVSALSQSAGPSERS